MRTILIVGAGFCGVACAVQLLRSGARVLLLERGRLGGLAYACCGAEHLLNVPAGKMSAFDDDANSFVRFAGSRASDFVPRRVYGDYLAALVGEAARTAGDRLTRVSGQAIALRRDGAGMIATLADERILHADRVILATGHFPPCDPLRSVRGWRGLHHGGAGDDGDRPRWEGARYLADPWDGRALAAVHPAEPVLLLGSGLTAVDMALTLLARGARQITMLSRHGLLPQVHRGLRGPPPAQDIGPRALWGDANTVREQLRGLRRFLRAAGTACDWRDAMVALRPHAPAIWQAWPERERQRFLRHVQAYWDNHRHRISPAAYEPLQRALMDGRVRVMAGRVLECTEDDERVRVTLRRRGAADGQQLVVARVINCTGSCASPVHCDDPLIAGLVSAGALTQDGSVAPAWAGRLDYVGPWLKAKYWEATAVPELRRFAAQAAARALT